MYLKESRHQIQIYTDHKNLLYFTIIKVLNRKQIRWSEELSSYNFAIQYRKKSDNSKTDVLSRRADHMTDKFQISQTILQKNSDDFIIYNRQNAVTLRIYNRDLKKKIKQKLAKNFVAQNVIQNIVDNKDFDIHQEILTFQDLIYVSIRCKQEVINIYHNSRIHGHQEFDKIIERIFRIYYFSKIRKQIEETIRKCDICARTKHNRHKFYKLFKSSSTPNRAWKSITLNFIIKLLKFKERVTEAIYDFILIIVNRLIKYSYFLSYKKANTAKDLVYTFFRTIIANHGLSDEIISNRDKLFTSKFWKSFVNQLEINHKLFMIYHSQTNEQTERMNQTLKQYFKCYINYRQNDWIQLLFIAQLICNSAIIKITEISSFFANYEFKSNILKESRRFAEVVQKTTIQIKQI